MGIGLDKLRHSKSPFHGIAPGKRVQPLGQIDLPICFGTAANFRKEVLTFEVMKMLGPKGVITVGSSFEHAYECNIECVEHAEALALDEALATQLQGMAEEAMDSKQRYAGNFESAEDTKDVPLDPKTPNDKALKISATLDSK
ncbi:uncharacterized protein LOC120669189 [Panicum virgatum]|uniref:uncharacterized protein LOC120669189 n=1 Tax=Panicum virgatum TaxID=38727 RepID=UPI0019D57D5E|nr:uncharacterized protein LOC120669189 [Panicum virgatum]